MHSGWKQGLGKNSRRQASSEALREHIAESPRQAGAQGLQQQDSPNCRVGVPWDDESDEGMTRPMRC
ncbi:MAG: hypothetical protein K0S85_1385 [Pseudomonas orientalis]|nr:hypothetical protein [Pseudomonas orientalis]